MITYSGIPDSLGSRLDFGDVQLAVSWVDMYSDQNEAFIVRYWIHTLLNTDKARVFLLGLGIFWQGRMTLG